MSNESFNRAADLILECVEDASEISPKNDRARTKASLISILEYYCEPKRIPGPSLPVDNLGPHGNNEVVCSAIDPDTGEFLGLIVPKGMLVGNIISIHGDAIDWAALTKGEPVDKSRVGVRITPCGTEDVAPC